MKNAHQINQFRVVITNYMLRWNNGCENKEFTQTGYNWSKKNTREIVLHRFLNVNFHKIFYLFVFASMNSRLFFFYFEDVAHLAKTVVMADKLIRKIKSCKFIINIPLFAKSGDVNGFSISPLSFVIDGNIACVRAAYSILRRVVRLCLKLR